MDLYNVNDKGTRSSPLATHLISGSPKGNKAGRIALIAGVVILVVIAALAAANYGLKKVAEFKHVKKILIRENLYVKSRIGAVQKALSQKAGALDNVKKDNEALQKRLDTVEQQTKELKTSYDQTVAVLSRKNKSLRRMVSVSKNESITARLREYLKGESNETIRQLLEYTLDKLELIGLGESVNLEPVMVGAEAPQIRKDGTVLSVDRQNSLVVVSLGRKDGMKEGRQLRILKDNQQLAMAEIVSLRYTVSAAFVYELRPKLTITDIGEGCVVLPEGK